MGDGNTRQAIKNVGILLALGFLTIFILDKTQNKLTKSSFVIYYSYLNVSIFKNIFFDFTASVFNFSSLKNNKKNEIS